MPKLDNTLQRICVRVWKEDYAFFTRVAEENGEVSINQVIRQALHSVANQMRARERQSLDSLKSEAAQ